MHVRLIRKHYQAGWNLFSRVAVALLVLELLFLCAIDSAQAATTVAYLSAEREDGYVASRVYAGRTMAERASELGFKQPGEISAVLVDVGDEVSKGDLLAELDQASIEAQLKQAQADVSLAAANVNAFDAETELAAQTEARFKELRDAGHSSEQVYDEQRLALRAKQAQLNVARASLLRADAARHAAEILVREAHIYAPFSGTIQSRHVDEGTQINAGENVLRLVETGRIEAHIGVPDSIARSLNTDQAYSVRWGNSSHSARLKAVLPEIDQTTRTLTAVFSLESTELPLGAVVELALESAVATPGYWLPLTALTESDRGLWGIFVIKDDSSVERRLVEIIHVEASQAFVRGTLNPGERVVKTGVQRIVPGQTVEVVQAG
jgi:RND family efflux transporter MFP subunit